MEMPRKINTNPVAILSQGYSMILWMFPVKEVREKKWMNDRATREEHNTTQDKRNTKDEPKTKRAKKKSGKELKTRRGGKINR